MDYLAFTMEKVTKLFISLFLCTATAFGQQVANTANFYDSAHAYYQKQDFKKAFYFYDTYYHDPKHGQSNYDTYYAAIAACRAGYPERASYYLQRSAKIGYDISAYDTFAKDSLNTCLQSLPEWKPFIENFKLQADSATRALASISLVLNDTSIRVNGTLLSDTAYWQRLAQHETAAQLLQSIKNFDRYPKPGSLGHWTLYEQRINDTLSAPFLCWIPAGYRPTSASPLFVFLHGGVSGPKQFGLPAYEPGQQQPLLQRAFDKNAFVLFPFAKRSFNWLRHPEAFAAILSEIARVKSLYHIDDNKVYIGGHSDGGRGAVWFALNHPSPFAAFYGICYYPSLYTGNTSLRNLHNTSPFYGISADSDSFFPPDVVFPLIHYDQALGGNWRTFALPGDHDLPYSSPEKVAFLFDSLLTQNRDPWPGHLVWETDNIVNGRCAWLEIATLDTTAPAATWHTPILPPVRGKDGTIAPAHFNTHGSGAVTATYSHNHFTMTTSRVGSINLYILDGMTDLKKPVTVIINGKTVFHGMIIADKALILSEFLHTEDRAAIPIRKLSFPIDSQ